jgi:transposase-like protein
MEQGIQKIDMKNEFRFCPTCGYADGLHSMFKRQGQHIHWLLICPSCHRQFDIGFTASLEQT